MPLQTSQKRRTNTKRMFSGKLFGYQAISNCFQGFAANTVSRVENQLREHPRLSPPSNYILLLLRVAACFRGFRAANNTFLRGYPMPGFAILRNVKDWVLMIAAVGNGLTTLTAIYGLEKSSEVVSYLPPQMDAVRQRRMKEERRILDKTLRTSRVVLTFSSETTYVRGKTSSTWKSTHRWDLWLLKVFHGLSEAISHLCWHNSRKNQC